MTYTKKQLREKYDSSEQTRALFPTFEDMVNYYRRNNYMKSLPVRYRVDVDFLSREYSDRALSVSSPIHTKKEGWDEYRKAIREKCADDPEKPARVHFWKYQWDESGKCIPLTIAKNY